MIKYTNAQIRRRFEDYIYRFNMEDNTTFDDYLATDMKMLNGGLEYEGIQNMKDHYAKIWGKFRETLKVQQFVCNQKNIAVQLWTHFEALHNNENTLFGAVKKGETFDYQGIVFYDLDQNYKFKTIRVAYNSFIFTNEKGEKINLGIPH